MRSEPGKSGGKSELLHSFTEAFRGLEAVQRDTALPIIVVLDHDQCKPSAVRASTVPTPSRVDSKGLVSIENKNVVISLSSGLQDVASCVRPLMKVV